MFRRLANDHWVLGVAAAIALGYALVELVRAVAARVLPFLANEDDFGYIVITVRGREVPLDNMIAAAATLAVVIAVSAIVLRRAAPRTLGE